MTVRSSQICVTSPWVRTRDKRTPPGRFAYELFKDWAQENGFRQMNNVTFGKKLGALGFEKRKSGDDWFWNLDWKPEAGYEARVSSLIRQYKV